MIRAELRSLFGRKLRTALTMIAIILGVSMISGTYVLTDTINSSFNKIFNQATRHIDAVVTGKAAVSGRFSTAPPVPASLLPIVRRTKGVLAADGEIADVTSLYELGHGSRRVQIGSAGGSPTLLFGVGDQRFNQLTEISGHRPIGNQIALDESTMTRSHLHIGQVIGVAPTSGPLRRFTISGETKFGNVGSIGGATLAEMDLRTAQVMTNKLGQFDQIAVMADKGTSQKLLVKRIRAGIPRSLQNAVRVRTGVKQAKSQEAEIASALNFLTIGLLAFGGIAVFVGAFIIFNTFSITVAQRAREFGLLRTLGATRAQVLSSVVGEASFVGLVASLLGMLAGLGIARGLNALFQAFGADLPNGGLVIERRTVIVAILVGTIVTIGSGLMPAIRATRVPPIAAMREGMALPKGRLGRYLPYIAGLVILIGLGATVGGIFASIADAGHRLALIGFGCALLFIGVAMFSPQLISPLATVIGWPIQKLTTITGRLARENAVRNPSRTAITAAALMIGLALVAFVTIFAAELKKTSDDIVNRNVAGTFIVQNNASEGNNVPSSAASQMSRIGGITLISPVKSDVAQIRGIGTKRVDGIQPTTFGRVYRFQWKTGSNAVARSLGTHESLIADGFASAHHLRVGSRLRLLTPVRVRDSFTVHGIFKSSQLVSDVLVPIRTFARDWHQPNDEILAANASHSAKLKPLESRINAFLARQYPTLSVSSQAQFKAQQDQQVNSLLALIYVLLGLSIVVSLFGIINTLVLSIYERTREIGMLRAIGATRSQIRWMIRWESVITALIGAVLGLLIGILLAFLITAGLQSQGIEYALPVGQLLIWVAVAIAFGIGAAAFPARRAARLDVLKAVSYE